MFNAGVDIGSRTVKVVLTETNGKKVAAWGVTNTGPIPAQTATDLFAQTLEEHQIDRGDLGRIYGINGINHSEIPREHRAWFAQKALAGGGASTAHRS